jgi:hypothetical protein
MKSKKPLILIPVFVSAIALGVVFYPQEAQAHGNPSYSIDTMWVYEDNTANMGTGTAVCTGVTITSGGTCSGTMYQGRTYRIELQVNEVVGDNGGDPTQFVMQSAVGNLDVAGVTPSYGSGGCDADRTGLADQTNWTPSTNGAAIDVDSGTTCTVSKSGTEYFYFIVTLDADDADDDTATFFITDGTNTFTTGAVSFTVDPDTASPTYVVDLLSVYQSESTTIGSGAAICTAIDLESAGDTCSGTIEYGFPYRFEVTVRNDGGAAGSPTSLEIDSSVGTNEVFGTVVAADVLDSGCSTNTDWTESIVGGTDVRAASGTTCSITASGGTAVFWIVVKVQVDTGGLGATQTSTFTIDDGAVNDVSTTTTFLTNNVFLSGGGVY